MDANGNPVRIFIAAGTTADCKLGEMPIDGIDAFALLADRGYDANSIIGLARSLGMAVVIPPKKNRMSPQVLYFWQPFGRDLYTERLNFRYDF